MNQHEFVRQCFERYSEEGAHPSDGDLWEDAHYPDPKGTGDQTIKLRHNDHQVQGILQSVEYNRMCFFPADVKRFLIEEPFVDGWFDLYDLYEKFASLNGQNLCKQIHRERDNEGRSLHILKTNEKVHKEKNSEGKSVHAVFSGSLAGASTHSQKNEIGQSLHNIRLHSLKNDSGKSVQATRMAKGSHREKTVDGKSKHAVTAGTRGGKASAVKNSKAVILTHTKTGDVFLFPSISEACQKLDLNGCNLSQILSGDGKRKQHKGYTIELFPGPNPFF